MAHIDTARTVALPDQLTRDWHAGRIALPSAVETEHGVQVDPADVARIGHACCVSSIGAPCGHRVQHDVQLTDTASEFVGDTIHARSWHGGTVRDAVRAVTLDALGAACTGAIVELGDVQRQHACCVVPVLVTYSDGTSEELEASVVSMGTDDTAVQL